MEGPPVPGVEGAKKAIDADIEKEERYRQARTHTSESNPIRVDFVTFPRSFNCKGKLGMTFAPGKQQEFSATGVVWRRDVESDVSRLRAAFSADVLVSLMEDHEYPALKIEHLFDTCKKHSIEVIHFPIVDTHVPKSVDEARRLVDTIHERLGKGQTVVIHCMGGLGRTGTIAACTLVKFGMEAEAAIALVRSARKGAVNSFQGAWIADSFVDAGSASCVIP